MQDRNLMALLEECDRLDAAIASLLDAQNALEAGGDKCRMVMSVLRLQTEVLLAEVRSLEAKANAFGLQNAGRSNGVRGALPIIDRIG